MRRFMKVLSIVLVLAIIVPGVVNAVPLGGKVEINRLAGKDRASTAVAASKIAYPNGADTVVLAGFKGEVDALTGTLLASDKGAPVLLTHKDKLTDVTKGEIKRLKPKTVYILGGEAVVSSTVEKELKKDYIIVRVEGKNRFETAIKIAKKVKTESNDVFLALGIENLADALAIGPVSARNNTPVLLTRTGELPKETIKAMEDLKVKNVTIIGGKAAVSDKVKASLEKKYTVKRVYGNDREDTALSVAKTYFGKRENIVVAYGRTYADALVGGYLGAKLNAPILLTNNKGLSKDTEKYIFSNPFKTTVLGGESVISKAIYNRIKQLLNGEVDDSNPAPDGSTITRGEWLKLLTQKLSIEPMDLGEDFSYLYGDTKGSEYGVIVETAHALGLLPEPDKKLPMFEENKPATREFAAYTVAKGMGFEGVYGIESSDISQVKYPSEVAVVVQQKFLQLEGNKFLPNKSLIATDKNRIFDRIDYFNDSVEIKESDFKDKVILEDNVVQVKNSDYRVVENTDGTFTVTLTKEAETNKIAGGTIFMLPPSDDFIAGIALKVNTIKDNNGKLVLTCEVPELEEVAKEIDFAGYIEVDHSSIKLADGVVADYNTNSSSLYRSNKDDGKAKGEVGPIKLQFHETKFGDSGISFTGDIEVSMPKIKAKAKFEGGSLDEVLLSVENGLEVKGNVKYDFGFPKGEYDLKTNITEKGSGKNEIVRWAVPTGVVGLSVDIILFYNIELDGTISIGYSLDNTNGIQYKDGALRDIKDFKADLVDLEINAEARLGMGVGVSLNFAIIDIVGIDFHVGVGAKLSYEEHTDVKPYLYCGEGKLYIYLSVDLKENCLLVEVLKRTTEFELSWEIYNIEKSPWNLLLHLENGKRVPECTYGKGDILGKVIDEKTNDTIGNARIKIYTDKANTLLMTVFTKDKPDLNLQKGEFLAEDLPKGTYNVEITAEGYGSSNIAIKVEAGKSVIKTIFLSPTDDGNEGEWNKETVIDIYEKVFPEIVASGNYRRDLWSVWNVPEEDNNDNIITLHWMNISERGGSYSQFIRKRDIIEIIYYDGNNSFPHSPTYKHTIRRSDYKIISEEELWR